jgi:hypothetical protein
MGRLIETVSGANQIVRDLLAITLMIVAIVITMPFGFLFLGAYGKTWVGGTLFLLCFLTTCSIALLACLLRPSFLQD